MKRKPFKVTLLLEFAEVGMTREDVLSFLHEQWSQTPAAAEGDRIKILQVEEN